MFLASLIFRGSASGPRKGLCPLTPLGGLTAPPPLPPRPPAVYSLALQVIFYLALLGFISQTFFNFVNSCLFLLWPVQKNIFNGTQVLCNETAIMFVIAEYQTWTDEIKTIPIPCRASPTVTSPVFVLL